jgi:hypothetical protein
MDIIFNIVGHVVVDDELNVLDIYKMSIGFQ